MMDLLNYRFFVLELCNKTQDIICQLSLFVKYRSRTDLIGQILESANGSATKTKIMYKAFLSYAQLKEYLAVLVANGLLTYDKKTELYTTTDKGHKFLKIYNQMGTLAEQEIKELPRM